MPWLFLAEGHQVAQSTVDAGAANAPHRRKTCLTLAGFQQGHRINPYASHLEEDYHAQEEELRLQIVCVARMLLAIDSGVVAHAGVAGVGNRKPTVFLRAGVPVLLSKHTAATAAKRSALAPQQAIKP